MLYEGGADGFVEFWGGRVWTEEIDGFSGATGREAYGTRTRMEDNREKQDGQGCVPLRYCGYSSDYCIYIVRGVFAGLRGIGGFCECDGSGSRFRQNFV